MKWNWFFVGLLLLAAGLVAWWWNDTPEAIPPHRLLRPSRGDITRGVIAIGRVEPRTRIEVKSKANGILQKLHVDVNQRVKAGQVLAELDREILQARVAEAEGKLGQALAEVERSKAMLQALELEKDDPEFSFAETNWSRLQRLFEQSVVSEDELDLARERRERALYRLRVLEPRLVTQRAVLTASEGRVREVRAQAELASQELQETRIVSPIDGVVLYRFLEEGDAVSSIRVAGGNATVIMTLGDLSELYVDGEVDEADVGKIIAQQTIRPDLVARVSVASYKDRTFLGRVSRITPLGLEDSNGIVTFEVRITLENPEKLLLANMTANSLIVLEERQDVVLLSQGALMRKGESTFAIVYDPDSGNRETVEVKVGISDGSHVEILAGLHPGQQVLMPGPDAASGRATGRRS